MKGADGRPGGYSAHGAGNPDQRTAQWQRWKSLRRARPSAYRPGSAYWELPSPSSNGAGMADADVGSIVAAAGVAHGTFFFHFPTKEHVLLELERREEERIAKQLDRYVGAAHDLSSTLKEAVRLILGLERRLGASLFKDFLALHFSQTRPADESKEHPVIVRVAQEIERAQRQGHVGPEVVPLNSAVFFLLGLYALLTTTHDWPTQSAMLDDYVASTLRSLERSN